MPLFLPDAQTLMINVLDKGADPTGTNDSTSAIQAAINAAGSNGVVWFPYGNYIISSALIVDNSQVALIGQGEQFTTQITIASSADPSYALIVGNTQSVAYCTIQGLTFKGRNTTTSTGAGIHFRCTIGSVKQCRIIQFGGTGIHVESFNASVISDVYMEDVYLTQNGMNTTTPGDNFIVENTVTDCEYHRVISAGNAAKNTTRYGFNNNGAGTQKFTDCHAYFCSSHGFYQTGGGGTVIIGGEWETNAGVGIYLKSCNDAIIDAASAFGQTTTKDIVFDGVDLGSIMGCNCSSATSDKHIGVYGSTRTTIADNVVKNSTSAGIEVDSGSTRCIVHDNIVQATNGIYMAGQYCDVHDNMIVTGNITEQTGANFNRIHDNILYAGGGQTIVLIGASTKIYDNYGYNPTGPQTAPGIPASGTAIQNTFAFDCIVHIIGGTITAIGIGNTSTTTATGLTSNASGVSTYLAAGQWIKLTYSVAPTSWTWFGQ
jgi:parallel beta-helix repeat protein